MKFLWLLKQPITSFNHKKFIESFDINSFIQNQTILTCHCENSPFIRTEHGHVLNGDLQIVQYSKLRKLITKIHKHRKQSATYWDKAKSSTMD